GQSHPAEEYFDCWSALGRARAGAPGIFGRCAAGPRRFLFQRRDPASAADAISTRPGPRRPARPGRPQSSLEGGSHDVTGFWWKSLLVAIASFSYLAHGVEQT